MEHEVLVNLIVAAITFVLTTTSKKLWWVLSGLYIKLFDTLPDIKGPWLATYTEIDANGKSVVTTETIDIKQVGRLVWGEICNHTDDKDEYKFSGHIVGQTLVANSWGKKRRLAVGSCTFMLKVHGNSQSMAGGCIWHDYHSDGIDSSTYEWRRK